MQSSQRAATLIADAIMAIIFQGPRLRCRDLFTSILFDLDLEGDLPRVLKPWGKCHGVSAKSPAPRRVADLATLRSPPCPAVWPFSRHPEWSGAGE